MQKREIAMFLLIILILLNSCSHIETVGDAYLFNSLTVYAKPCNSYENYGPFNIISRCNNYTFFETKHIFAVSDNKYVVYFHKNNYKGYERFVFRHKDFETYFQVSIKNPDLNPRQEFFLKTHNIQLLHCKDLSSLYESKSTNYIKERIAVGIQILKQLDSFKCKPYEYSY